MNIPDEAVEAAAKAYAGREVCAGGANWEDWEHAARVEAVADMRIALEAATPHLLPCGVCSRGGVTGMSQGAPDEVVEMAARAMLEREPNQELWGLLDIKAGLEAAAPNLLSVVREQQARIERVEAELAHAEMNGHVLDGDSQGVSPGERVPAVRIAYIRAALTATEAAK